MQFVLIVFPSVGRAYCFPWHCFHWKWNVYMCVVDCDCVKQWRNGFVLILAGKEGRQKEGKKSIWVALCDDGNVFQTQRGAVKVGLVRVIIRSLVQQTVPAVLTKTGIQQENRVHVSNLVCKRMEVWPDYKLESVIPTVVNVICQLITISSSSSKPQTTKIPCSSV